MTNARDTAPPGRGGCVFLIHASTGWGQPMDDGMPWTGYWERGVPPGMLAEGAWDSAAAAIAWGRECSDEVVIRVDLPGRQYFAGVAGADREGLPAWPPEDAGRFDP